MVICEMARQAIGPDVPQVVPLITNLTKREGFPSPSGERMVAI